MSYLVSTLVYSRRVGSPVRKAVLAYFAERANDNGGGVWASKPTIAASIECGRSTVIRTINDFVAEGILREVGRRPCRGGSTTEYAMNLDAIAMLPSVDDEAPIHETRPAAGPVPEQDPSQSGTPPVPQRDPHPSRSGTQTIIGTIIEPSEEDLTTSAVPEPKARLPDDWALSDEGWGYARRQGIPDEAIQDEAAGFHAYWTDRRDRDAKKSHRGWEQCWAGWCRRIAQRYARHPGRGSPHDALLAGFQRSAMRQ